MDHLHTPSSSSGRKKDLSVKVTAQMRKTLVSRPVSSSSLDSSLSSSFASSSTSPSSALVSPAHQSRDFSDALHTPSTPSTPDTMAQQKAIDDCFHWISEQQKAVDRIELDMNKKNLEESSAELKKRSKSIADYRSTVDRTKTATKDEQQKDKLEQAYSELLSSCQKRLKCIENSSQILALEDLFVPLCNSFTTTATNLVQDMKRENGLTHNESSNNAATSQDCILANRDAWEHVKKQFRCAEVHLKNAAEYQEFFHDAKEYQQWMPAELRKADETLKQLKERKVQPEDAEEFLSKLKTALTTVLHWKSKMEAMTERSRKVLPVPLRLQKLDYERPALSLADFISNDTKIREGEELTLVDNTNKQLWKVRNTRGDVCLVPSTQLVIQGPDTAAAEASSKLRLQFMSSWTNMVKDLGKEVLRFLSQIVKDWTPEEEQMLKSLSPAKKQKIQQLLSAVSQIFSPAWDPFPPYQKLKQKMDRLKQMLNERAPSTLRPSDQDKLAADSVLVAKTDSVDDLVSNYKDWWDNWEQFKMLTESSRHPEYHLAVTSPDQYKFMSPADLKKKWQTGLMEFDETDFEETGTLEDEVYTIETAKETAETSQLTTSEQEERQTFVITGVIDPRSDEQISLDRAVMLGIINQREGKYVNPLTGESMPIPTAMNAGKIKVEFTRTNKSAEKRSDLGLITIKTFREARPFTVKSVVDAKTERQMTVDEAIRTGIMDQKRGIYVNKYTNEELSLADALDSGLLIVEFDNDGDDKSRNSGEPEYVAKTYAIHAVIDTKTMARKTFSEAVAAGLIDPLTGAYCNKSTGEHVYVGDAIKKGLIKATVVIDSNTLDIEPSNRLTLPDANINNFNHQQKPTAASGTPVSNGGRSVLNGVTNGSANRVTNGNRI